MKDQSVPLEGQTSRTLLQSAQAGDESAWQRIAAVYQPLIRRWARFGGVSEADLADVCQEVLFAASLKLKDFQRERTGSFRRWLKNITRNKVVSQWRKRRLAANEPLPDDLAEAADTSAVISEERHYLFERIVESVRSQFEEATWQMFRMTCMDGRPIADVAAELGKSRGAIDIARSRVLAYIREHFAEHIEEEKPL